LGGDPVARSLRIDVVEEAQNAVAVGGASGKSVGMQQVVALAQGEIASRFFLRPIARIVDLPMRAIRAEKSAKKVDDVLRITMHDFAQPFCGLRLLCLKTGNAICQGPVSDVFVEGAKNVLMTE